MIKQGISPMEAGLRLAELPFEDFEQADKTHKEVYKHIDFNEDAKNTPDSNEHDDLVGVFLINALSDAYRYADNIVKSLIDENDDTLKFCDPFDQTKDYHCRLTIPGVQSWCLNRGLSLPEPLEPELREILKAQFTLDGEAQKEAMFDLLVKIDELKVERDSISTANYKDEERRESNLEAINNVIRLLEKYAVMYTQLPNGYEETNTTELSPPLERSFHRIKGGKKARAQKLVDAMAQELKIKLQREVSLAEVTKAVANTDHGIFTPSGKLWDESTILRNCSKTW